MKSRELFTTHDLIVTNYMILSLSEDKYLHQFTTKTTGTLYKYISNNDSPIVEENGRYNVGYSKNQQGENVLELSALSKTSEVNPQISYLCAKKISEENHSVNKGKNDERVSHNKTDGYYWGKKYAWRRFGLMLSQNAFCKYLNEINHPSTRCTTSDPSTSHPPSESIAYKEEGLETAIEDLINSSTRQGNRYFKSPLYSAKFQIKGLKAITDKK